ncbi:hypothetical protein DTO212C5_8995 [Paecilomyces variotii]|nr:hypothetical protein DTO212C5_8995 [Paecilomyces variotii]
MNSPRTPVKPVEELNRIIETLNVKYELQLPNPVMYSPATHGTDKPLDWRCFYGIRIIYYNRNVDIKRVINNFEEWVTPRQTQWVYKRGQEPGTLPSQHDFLRKDGRKAISDAEREIRLRELLKLIDDEIYLINRGSYGTDALGSRAMPRDLSNGPSREHISGSTQRHQLSFAKRRPSDEQEVFYTAPSSPVESPTISDSLAADGDEFDDSDLDDMEIDAMSRTDDAIDDAQKQISPKKSKKRQSTIHEFLKTTKPLSESPTDKQAAGSASKAAVSFSTTASSSYLGLGDSRNLDTSFGTDATDLTDPWDYGPTQDSPIVDLMLGHEANDLFDLTREPERPSIPDAPQPGSPYEKGLVNELLEHGPFSAEWKFSHHIPVRCRYELERIAREWNLPSEKMLVGEKVPFSKYDDLWRWIENHGQRSGRALPEKSASSAWDSAVNQFKHPEKHSEVTVFSGDLSWCDWSERGILKLKLNPLRVEKSCRFHRRFGSDRFLTLTIPAPSRPAEHLRFPSHPSLLRESIVKWLTQNDHRCLGRTWRPFYVEEVKNKKKQTGEIRFRVEFFAVDGIDFKHNQRKAPTLAPAGQGSDEHTPMSVESLLEWHIPKLPNVEQSDCKLFQRISLALSKTWATAFLRPDQIFHLKDDPGKTVMNDGCALMSRALARTICDQLGISGSTPSCFQGRIAGAKGLWMVDRHNSSLGDGDELWIQISDSQLKVKPHPRYWQHPGSDKEKLTFEVTNWSKPLHSVDLNIQLLNILDNRGDVKDYVAGLVRDGIEEVHQDFTTAMVKDSPLLCRALVQKIRPPAEEGLSRNKSRALDSWWLDNSESVIRFLEAGFTPRNFLPLRKRLRNCLKAALDRYFEELHIRVPLSTYAYCIADPYGVLKEDEVHFGFSSAWDDPSFEDNMLDGVEVLVGRLPAHLPSDIQRRRAVWKQELRHFKDVIVFPTQGDIPLAHMLSGGDYDGDIPWICWDQNIVKSFRNAHLPKDPPGPEYFELVKHSAPMTKIHSTDEFLEKTFMFNLTTSNLGRCTVEHEKIVYEESLDSGRAQELAALLSHLVDSRKAGLWLPEDAWKRYRGKISPRARRPPAYKDPDYRGWNPNNIVDYLKFEVARREVNRVLKAVEDLYDKLDVQSRSDKDLERPWQTAVNRAREESGAGQEELGNALKVIKCQVEDAHTKWGRDNWLNEKRSFKVVAQAAGDVVQQIQPPAGDHPLLHTWRNSRYEWQRLLASCAYARYPQSDFVYYALGETLCRIKTGHAPARLVTDMMYSCYKFSIKTSQRLASKLDEEDSDGEYEGQEAIEALLSRGESIGFEYDDDDNASVE